MQINELNEEQINKLIELENAVYHQAFWQDEVKDPTQAIEELYNYELELELPYARRVYPDQAKWVHFKITPLYKEMKQRWDAEKKTVRYYGPAYPLAKNVQL